MSSNEVRSFHSDFHLCVIYLWMVWLILLIVS